jgi:hypothetical protein
MPLFRESMLASSMSLPPKPAVQLESERGAPNKVPWRREPRCTKTKIRRPKYLGLRNNCCNIIMTTESVYKTVKHNDDLEGTAYVIHACFIPAVELPRVMMAHPGSHGSNHILGFVSRNDQKCFGGSAAVCLLQGSGLWMCY